MDEDLKFLYKAQKEIYLLEGIEALLDWDLDTSMPSKATSSRSEQFDILQGIIKEKLCSKDLLDTIERLKSKKISNNDLVILKELEKKIEKENKIPVKHTKEICKAIIDGQEKWEEALKNKNFDILLPYLNNIIELKKKEVSYIKDKSMNNYDVLVNEYEEGMNSERLDQIFDYLKPRLKDLLKLIRESKKYKEIRPFKVSLNKKDTEDIILDLFRTFGISKDKISLKTSQHPFTTRISRNDIRVTANFSRPIDSFFAAFHELGHALYELGLPLRYNNTPLYGSASFGLDEAQALFFEFIVGRSEPFWKNYFFIFRKSIKENITWKEFYSSINRIDSSKIRRNTDEVNYCLHIILRYEIEKDLINDKIKAKDIKEIWNQKSKEILGFIPKDDKDGILQDIHWATGDIGYFPSYAIGMIYATQIYSQIRKEITDFDSKVERQEFREIIEWLNQKIYSKGRSKTAEHIIRSITGKDLEPKELIRYLYEKYSKIYAFEYDINNIL